MDSLDAFSGTYNDRLVRMAQEKRVPISGTFELLPSCNMHCRMCYIQHTPSRDELQKPEFWIELFKQAIEEGMLFPLLTGGEPFMYPWFYELYERLAKMPIHICINTNGTLLNRETVAFLAKQPPRRLNISLYGASDETYAKLCGNPQGFTQVTYAFELLKEYGIQFRIHSPMVPENETDYQKIIDICNDLQVPLSRVYYMFPAYRKESSALTAQGRYTPAEMARIALQYKSSVLHHDSQVYRQFILLNSQAQKTPEIYTAYGHNEINCKSGKCIFWVDWRGRMSGCGVHNQMTYDLHDTPFTDAWKQIVKDTESIYISEKCRFCKYRSICPVCPAACFCETGKMDGTPEYLCQFSEEFGKLLMEERKRLFGDK